MRKKGNFTIYYKTQGILLIFFFQAEDGIRDVAVTGVQTCALPICLQSCSEPRITTMPSLVFLRAIDGAPDWASIRKDLAYTYLKIGETEAARDQFAEADRKSVV